MAITVTDWNTLCLYIYICICNDRKYSIMSSLALNTVEEVKYKKQLKYTWGKVQKTVEMYFKVK